MIGVHLPRWPEVCDPKTNNFLEFIGENLELEATRTAGEKIKIIEPFSMEGVGMNIAKNSVYGNPTENAILNNWHSNKIKAGLSFCFFS